MKKLIISLLYFCLIVLLGLASLYGVVIRRTLPQYPVGVLQLGVFENGLGFFQQNRTDYYTFSPFNDYLVLFDGSRKTLISQKELEEKSFTSDYKKSHLEDIKQTILGYFKLGTPEITFKTDNEINYSAQINGSKVLLTRNLKLASKFMPQLTALTLAYQGSDFVYDPQGTLYNYQLPDDLALFNKLYETNLFYQVDLARTEIPGKTIIISNPNLAGVIVVKAQEKQKMFVNVDTHLIEIEQPVNSLDNQAITVEEEIYDNPLELKKAR